MKRFLFAILLMGLFVVFMEPAGNLLSNLLRLDQPLSHEIKNGDWLSKISQQYYGDSSYWKELALINRAPNGDKIFPGEKLMVPSFEAIQRVRQARRLSDVNEVANLQQDILAGRVKVHSEPIARSEREALTKTQPANTSPSTVREVPAEPSAGMTEPLVTAEPSPAIEPPEGEASNGVETSFWLSTPVVTGVMVVAVILVMAVFMYHRKQKREEVDFYGESSKTEEDDKKNPFLFDDEVEDRRKNGSKKEKDVPVAS
ncbi:MAG TPA: LysM peptidoglycan-binding domain-containing protein [bacterium]